MRHSPCIKAPTPSNPSVTCLMERVIMFCLYSATLLCSWVVVRIDLMNGGPISHAIRLNASRSWSMVTQHISRLSADPPGHCPVQCRNKRPFYWKLLPSILTSVAMSFLADGKLPHRSSFGKIGSEAANYRRILHNKADMTRRWLCLVLRIPRFDHH